MSLGCNSDKEARLLLQNSFRRSRESKPIILPKNAFHINNELNDFKVNSRNVSTTLPGRRNRLTSNTFDSLIPQTEKNCPNNLNTSRATSRYQEDTVISNAIQAMSRGDKNRRSYVKSSSKSYYDRHIKQFENLRLKQFTQQGKNQTVNSFVAMSVLDVDDPRKAI